MKKKVKLFSTIASLCLAVALMAFGVWAATTASVGVTSSVTYTVSGQVNMKFSVKVEFTTGHVAVEHAEEDTTVKHYASTTQDTKTINSWWVEQVPGEAKKTPTINLGDYKFNADSLKDETVVYTIKIENKATESAWVEVSGFTATDDTNYAITSTIGDGMGSAKVAGNATFTYVVTFKLSDPTKGMKEDKALAFSPKFEIYANTEVKPGA